MILSLALSGTFNIRSAERERLTGHIPPAASRLQPLASLPGSTRLNLAIGLPLRNRKQLADLLQEIYDPGSPNFHHYLTTRQFTELFGPTEQDYQKVMDFAAMEGLRVTGTHPNRLLVDVSGDAADVERAFQVRMKLYQHPTEPRTFFAPDVEPTVEAGLPVLDISGLNNFVTPHPMSLKSSATNQAQNARPASGSGPSGTYIGNDFRSAYVPNVSLDGTGQIVGLFELDGYYANDISNYEYQAGLSSVPLTNVLVDGFSGSPDGNANFIAEVSLDIEMAIAMAPRLSSVMVYEASNVNLTITVINDVLNRMATDNLAKQLSSSWSWGGGTNATGDQIFLEFAAQGQSFFEASGDSGAYVFFFNPINEPSDDRYITIVGGTTVTTSGPGGLWVSEKVWSWFPSQADASSGGISTLFPIPSWQQGLNMTTNQGSTTMRNIPDVALTADNVFVIYNNGSKGDFGGTSCAAPLWAGFTALVNQHGAAHGQPTLGFINPAVYAIGKGTNYTSDFHDITTGNNTNSSSPTQFLAVSGYDLCTGWGTPNGTNMINALLPGLVPISPVLTWTNPASIVYGTVLSSIQLNATANVAGTFAYHPAAGTVLDVGNKVLSVTFTPNDTFDYNTVTSTVAQVVMHAPLNVTAANTNRIFGLANPAFQGTITGLQNGDNITAAYTCSATAASPVGTYPIVPSLIDPNNLQTNYTVTLVNGTLTVQKAPSIITWTNPTPIVYGTALSSGQLDATANVPGSFAYNPTSGTVLNVGTNTLSVTFTPNDTFDYNTVTSTVAQVVMPAPLNVTAANTNRIYGLSNPAFQGTITGLQNGDNITAAYSCSATAVSPVGTYPIVPNLIDPSHLETNYTVTLVNGTLTVQKAPSVITWTNPAPIVYGTALSSIQLNATANVPGTFAYNPTNGTVLNVGTNTLSVTFTPADITDYTGATDSVSLVITAPQVPTPAGEPLLPTWGVATLFAALMAVSLKYVANLPANDEGNRT